MIRVRQIKVSINEPQDLKPKIAKKLHIDENNIVDYKINKQSIDARHKEDIKFIYEVDVELNNESSIKLDNIDILKTPDESFRINSVGDIKLDNQIVIVGSGPAGLFAAYILADYGYKPLVIERGSDVDTRVSKIEEFWKTGKLDINTNVQFGEGGAGTFSDGKLNTLVNDKEFIGRKVFEIFVENGAPKEIMYSYKPHIGTDILRDVIKNMRKHIIDKGGVFRFNTCLTDINIVDNKVKSIIVNNEETIECSNLVLAIGHSARDTFKMLYDKQIKMEAKPFAVGVRVEHKQSMINESMYGRSYDVLGPATYKLTYNTKDGRGVYSFCMCPGGYVVNASSEDKHLVVNGMSNYARESENANAALVVTVSPKDFGTNPLDGVEFQRDLEIKAFNICNGKIPVQLYKDFVDNNVSTKLGNVNVITKGDYELSNINDILPEYIKDSIKEAMPEFGKKIKGYDNDNTLLLGLESRTSSPVRIIRNDELVSSIDGLYPIGEGAGYAGGITTAAIDGVRIAKKLISIYHI